MISAVYYRVNLVSTRGPALHGGGNGEFLHERGDRYSSNSAISEATRFASLHRKDIVIAGISREGGEKLLEK